MYAKLYDSKQIVERQNRANEKQFDLVSFVFEQSIAIRWSYSTSCISNSILNANMQIKLYIYTQLELIDRSLHFSV